MRRDLRNYQMGGTVFAPHPRTTPKAITSSMNIVIDITRLQDAAANPILFTVEFFRAGGWALVLMLFFLTTITLGVNSWLKGKRLKHLQNLKYVMLALDIPKNNEQTPKAVESVFSHIHGIQRGGNKIDVYWKGYIQAPISFEIVGIEGEIQFLIRCTSDARDLVEASIYAQYPEAAITEVRDYTEFVPQEFEEAGYDLWGSELVLYNKDVFPFRTYPFFEHQQTQTFLDPLASLLEILGRLGPTEQVWIQLVLTPADDKWKDRAKKMVRELIGDKPTPKQFMGGYPATMSKTLYEMVTATLITPGEPAKPEKKEKPKFSELTIGEKGVTEAIQMKAGKLGWNTRFRVVYLAKKEFFTKGRGVAGVLGAIKQFNTQDLNGFKPDSGTKTAADYYFVKRRVRKKQHAILKHAKARTFYKDYMNRKAPKPFILNVEELASIFHFPVMTVKAPQMQKTEARRGEPPIRLPVEPAGGYETSPPHSAAPSSGPPPNLPTG